MSAWDVDVVKVGKGTHRGGGDPRPIVVKNNAQRNQAARQGNLTTTKKVYGTANGSVSAVMNGQRAAAVDRADGPKPARRDKNKERVQANLKLLCQHLEIGHDQLAKVGMVRVDQIFMSRNAAPIWQPDPKALKLIENKYGWCIRSGKYGPMGNCKHDDQKLEYQNKVKSKWDGNQPKIPGDP